MFSNKSRVQQLTAELETLKNQPFLGLARQIQEEVDRATAEGAMDIDAVLEAAISRTKEETLLQALEARLDNMDPHALLQLYSARLGDEKANMLLAQKAKTAYDYAHEEQFILELRHEAHRSRRIDLTKVPVGMIVTIGLFDPEDDDEDKVYGYEDDALRVISGRIDHPEKPNLFTIIKDVRDDDYLKVKGIPNSFADHALVEIGSLRHQAGEEPCFVAELTRLTYPTFVLDDKGPKTLPYDVGFVLIGETVILG